MVVQLNEQMQCRVALRNEAARGEGTYIDLKAEPHRVSELPESKAWPGLGKFVEAINRLADLRTTGCKAAGVTPGGYDAPFVDVAFVDPALAKSESANASFRQQFAALHGITVADGLALEICQSYALFPDNAECESARIWFIGPREMAEQAFPVVLGFLAAQQATGYQHLACGTGTGIGYNAYP